jgi:hypothetical protein
LEYVVEGRGASYHKDKTWRNRDSRSNHVPIVNEKIGKQYQITNQVIRHGGSNWYYGKSTNNNRTRSTFPS